MKQLFLAIVLGSAAVLTGCAGTSALVKTPYKMVQGEQFNLQLNKTDNISAEGLSILQNRLNDQLTANSLLAGNNTAKRTVEVTITNYYMRHGAARALAGIMAGVDNIKSTVKVKDAATGQVLSEFNVESKNPTAWGTSKGLIEQHADKIVAILKGAKK